MNSVVVLDVGHGNCTIIESNGSIAVVDSPVGNLLLDTLEDRGISSVDAAFISHADKDHIAGVLALLTSDRIRVGRIYVNPDAERTSAIWEDFRVAVSIAERKGGCTVLTSLTSTSPGKVMVGDISIDVVAPSAALALSGVGGRSLSGQTVSANFLSAVLRVELGPDDGILLAGDMDAFALQDALNHDANLRANVLVFPHHGGLPGRGSIAQFVSALLAAVKPEAVVFSNGRGRFDNPRPEVVRAVTANRCYVACTQLSKRCYSEDAPLDTGHLELIRAHGNGVPASCAGSMCFELAGGARRSAGAQERHRTFIEQSVPSPMCRRALKGVIALR